MALKVKAVERLLKFDKEKEGKYRYVLSPDLYTSLSQEKVIKEAAQRSGVMPGVIRPVNATSLAFLLSFYNYID
jgi:Asp-tRNA(Asn)/Glu-tRNA(Gln) amidotransferase B subunit